MKGAVLLSCLVAAISARPNVLSYEAVEAGHGQPGTAVSGEFFYKVPEGDTVRLTYTADTAGYLAAGDHLPVSPALPEIAPVPLPAMVEDTVEVAAARAAFQQEFAAVEARNAE